MLGEKKTIKLVYLTFYIISNTNIIYNEICSVKNSQNPNRVDWSRAEVSGKSNFRERSKYCTSVFFVCGATHQNSFQTLLNSHS